MNIKTNFQDDFSDRNYQIQDCLRSPKNHNLIKYLAVNTLTKQSVIIEQFKFVSDEQEWHNYYLYEENIHNLQKLNHPLIPRYLDAFPRKNGFCLVHEYKNSPILESINDLSPEKVKEIAELILTALVYLQNQEFPILHHNITPKNILVDSLDPLKIYLVGLKFPLREEEAKMINYNPYNSLGFIPPEQTLNVYPTQSSDLYSLGVTLICLITNTKSHQVARILNNNTYVDFNCLKNKDLTYLFEKWLNKLVALDLNERYLDAKIALTDLQDITAVTDNLHRQITAKQQFLQRLGKFNLIDLVKVSSVTIVSLVLLFICFRIYLVVNLRETGQCPNCLLFMANLMGNNLNGANLENANLFKADLERAILGGANLKQSNLSGAKLTEARLEKANLNEANLESAKFENTLLENANLKGANLKKVNLSNANLRGANLEGANLERANLKGANLENVNLTRANLKGAILTRAILENATLKKADLGRSERWLLKFRPKVPTNLSKANLENANLAEAFLAWTILESANLKKANLESATLKAVDLERANLEAASLENSYLERVNFQEANLEQANFQDTVLKNIYFKGANINQVNWNGSSLEGVIMPDGTEK